jgi:hypothetical protein
MNKKPDLLAEHHLAQDKAETERRLKDALRRLHTDDTDDISGNILNQHQQLVNLYYCSHRVPHRLWPIKGSKGGLPSEPIYIHVFFMASCIECNLCSHS